MKYKIVLMNAILIVVLVISSCAGREEVRVPDRELSGELLVALSYYYDTYHRKSREPKDITARTSFIPIHQKILRFMEKHPKVTIKVMDSEWQTRYAFGSGRTMSPRNFINEWPDIIELTPHQATWMMDNELHELSFYYENSPLPNKWSEEYSYLNELVMVDGGQYLLPVTTDPMIVFYSAPIFEQLGIDRPADDWTWDDFFSIARRVKDAGYFNGVFYTTRSLDRYITVDNIEHFIVAHGGEFMSLDQKEFAGYLDGDRTQQAFELYLDVFEPLFVTNPEWYAKRLTPPNNVFPAFGMGRASRLFSILDVDDPLEKDVTKNRGYELLPMPRTDDGRALNTTLVTGLAITEQSQHKELAWEFMKFIVSDEGDDNDRNNESDGDPMRFVAENRLVNADSRFIKRQPEQYDNLIELMQMETLNSMASSMHFVPQFISSNIYDETGDLNHTLREWGINLDNPLPKELERIRGAVEEMRDEMIEHGIRVPWWGKYGLSF